MFDIAWTELLVVAVIAVLVVGPKELPGMLRAFGKTFGQLRRTAREFQSTFNEALREAERDAKLDDVKKSLDGVRNMNPAKDLTKALKDTEADINRAASGAKTPGNVTPADEAMEAPAPVTSASAKPAPAKSAPAPEPAPEPEPALESGPGEAPRKAAADGR